MDFEKVVRTILTPLIGENDVVDISINKSGKVKTITLKTDRRTAGNIIGHRGTTVNAIREVVNIGAKKEHSIVRIEVVNE